MIKARKESVTIALFVFFVAVAPLCGQEGGSTTGPLINSSAEREEITSPWSVSADILSGYIWRGTMQGSGPHVQPAIEYAWGSFTAGAWGTFDLHGYEEVDLWFGFNIPGGFTIGIQDYYLPGLLYFDYTAADGSHAFEINLDYAGEHVWFSGNCVINEAGGIGSYGGDLYFEAGFSFDYFRVFMGAGNKWHTERGGFSVCNLGLEISEEIPVTDRFSLPVTGQMIFNPDREQLLLAVGFSF